jgi:hypothetical protein
MSDKISTSKQCLQLRYIIFEQKDSLAGRKFFRYANTLDESSAFGWRQKSKSYEASWRLLS